MFKILKLQMLMWRSGHGLAGMLSMLEDSTALSV